MLSGCHTHARGTRTSKHSCDPKGPKQQNTTALRRAAGGACGRAAEQRGRPAACAAAISNSAGAGGARVTSCATARRPERVCKQNSKEPTSHHAWPWHSLQAMPTSRAGCRDCQPPLTKLALRLRSGQRPLRRGLCRRRLRAAPPPHKPHGRQCCNGQRGQRAAHNAHNQADVGAAAAARRRSAGGHHWRKVGRPGPGKQHGGIAGRHPCGRQWAPVAGAACEVARRGSQRLAVWYEHRARVPLATMPAAACHQAQTQGNRLPTCQVQLFLKEAIGLGARQRPRRVVHTVRRHQRIRCRRQRWGGRLSHLAANARPVAETHG